MSMPTPKHASRGLGVALTCLLALTGACPDALASDDDVILIQFLAGTGADPDGTARARWRDKGDSVDFNVELSQVPDGTYELIVAGVSRGNFDVTGGHAEIEFESPLDPPKPLFDFEVFGQSIEVVAGAVTYFSDVFDPGGSGAPPTGGGAGKTKLELFMVNVGPDTNAKGKVRYEAKSGKTRFKVTVEKLDAGFYDLVVGGEIVASIETTGPAEVETEFRDPVEPGTLLLDFAPLGKSVELVQGVQAFLSVFLPGDAASTGVKLPGNAKKLAKDVGGKKRDALRVSLLPTGILPGVKGTATLDLTDDAEFEVEVEGAGSASLELWVDDVVRGMSLPGDDGFVFGDDDGSLPFEFPVRGLLLEVRAGSDTILAGVFPTSVQEALGKFVKEFDTTSKVRRNLVNQGVDLDARGWARARSGSVARLDLKVQDLPAGTFELRVGGSVHATFEVLVDGGTTRLRFASNATGLGKVLPLDFDPSGEVEIAPPAGEAWLLAVLP